MPATLIYLICFVSTLYFMQNFCRENGRGTKLCGSATEQVGHDLSAHNEYFCQFSKFLHKLREPRQGTILDFSSSIRVIIYI